MKLYSIKDEIAFEVALSDEHFFEKDIENFIQKNSNILLNEQILIFGRQVHTASGKILDLLALDKYGRIIVIELKRGLAPRDMMAQILDYSSWLKKLPERELENIARNYFNKNNLPYKSIHTAFEEFFKVQSAPTIGSELVNVLFAQEYPDDLLNAVSYLAESGIPIYLLKFNWFKDKAGSKFILIEKLIGEDEEEEYSKNENDKTSINIGEKQSIRQLFNKLKNYLESNYLAWANQFDAEWRGFRVTQSRNGDWVSVSLEWKIQSGSINIIFAYAYIKERYIFISRLSYPKSYMFEKKILLTNSLKDEHYIDKSNPPNSRFWERHFAFTKYLREDASLENLDFNYDNALKNIELEFPYLQKCLEMLLDKK